jgi:hypothetical protein
LAGSIITEDEDLGVRADESAQHKQLGEVIGVRAVVEDAIAFLDIVVSPFGDLPFLVPHSDVLSGDTPLVVLFVEARGHEDLIVGLEVHGLGVVVELVEERIHLDAFVLIIGGINALDQLASIGYCLGEV